MDSFLRSGRLLVRRRIIWAVLYCLLLSGGVFGATLSEYQADLESARALILGLIDSDKGSANSSKDILKFESASLTQIRQLLPPTNEIDMDDGLSIRLDNSWVGEKLTEFEEAERGSLRRDEILTEISERLDSIENSIKQLENAEISARSRDENKRKMAEILGREEFQKPSSAEESIFQKLYRRLMEWITGLFPKPALPNAPATGFQSLSFILQIVLYALVLGAIGFLAYKFGPKLLQRFKRREKEQQPDRVILGEKLSADQDADNLFRDAERLAREGNLRGAIRKGYIALLCELSDRRIIGLSRHKTNRDYLRDVRDKGELYQDMDGLTLNFERHWYGADAAEEDDWEEFKNGYRKALR